MKERLERTPDGRGANGAGVPRILNKYMSETGRELQERTKYEGASGAAEAMKVTHATTGGKTSTAWIGKADIDGIRGVLIGQLRMG